MEGVKGSVLKVMNAEDIKKDWDSRGYSFGIFRDPPGQVWADFVHSTDELVLLAEGEIEIDIEGSRSNLLLVKKFLFLLIICTQFVISEIKITFGITDTKNIRINYEQTKNLGNFRNK